MNVQHNNTQQSNLTPPPIPEISQEISELSEISDDSLSITTASMEPSGIQKFTIFKRIGLSLLELSIQAHFAALMSHLIPERSWFLFMKNVFTQKNSLRVINSK